MEPVVQQVFAGPMGNCLYILADPSTKKAFIVDPAWDPLGLMQTAADAGFEVEAVLATHLHQDHVGGDLFGQKIPGVAELLQEHELPIYIHEIEAAKMIEQTGVPEESVRRLSSEQQLGLGDLQIDCLHTPGHSPGGIAFLVGGQSPPGAFTIVKRNAFGHAGGGGKLHVYRHGHRHRR